MNNMKKKVLIASFFSVLMLMVPFVGAVAEKKEVENLNSQQVESTQQELLQMRSSIYKKYDLRDILNLIVKYDLKYLGEYLQGLIENGENLQNTEVLQAKISYLFANEEPSSMETTFEDSMDTTDVGTCNEVVGSVDSEEAIYGSVSVSGEKTVEMISTKAENLNEETDYTETIDDIIRYIAGDSFSETSTPYDNERTITWYTPGDDKLIFGTPSPINGSSNQPLALNWSILINHSEGKTFDWTIECSNGQKNSSNNDVNGTKELSLYALNYSTSYVIWVNATESGNSLWTRASYIFTTTDGLKERLGWISKTIELRNTRKELWNAFLDSFWPNITWIDAIETFSPIIFKKEVNVTNYIFVTLNQTLRDLASRLFGGNAAILSAILNNGIPLILQTLYGSLNQKIGGLIKASWHNYKRNLRTLIKSFFKTIKGMTPFKAFRRALRSLAIVYIGIGISIAYYAIHPSEFREYLEGIPEAYLKWQEALINNINYVASEPWSKPINLSGNVVGLDSDELGNLQVYCEKDPDTSVLTNPHGCFEKLYYISSDEEYPWGLHNCTTTAKNQITGEKATVGNSGNKINDLIRTGAFSDGNLNLKINFNAGDDNNVGYVQSQSNEAIIQGQVTTEIKTQEKPQYQLTVIRELITFLVTNRQ